MKKYVISLLIVLLLSINIVSAQTEDVTVEIPGYDVTLNGTVINIVNSEYPIIVYKNITYFPMTYDYLSGIGLSLNFSNTTGLSIEKLSKVDTFNQSFLNGSNTLGDKRTAQTVPFSVKVNGTEIDNNNEEYPVLLYNDITYFPMTWRFAVTEFGWVTSWDDGTGFGIQTSSEYVVPANVVTPLYVKYEFAIL